MASSEQRPSCGNQQTAMSELNTLPEVEAMALRAEAEGHHLHMPERVYNIDEETRMGPDMVMESTASYVAAPRLPQAQGMQQAVPALHIPSNIPANTAQPPSSGQKSPINSFSALSFIAEEYGESGSSSPASSHSPAPVAAATTDEQRRVPPNPHLPSEVSKDGSNSGGFNIGNTGAFAAASSGAFSAGQECFDPVSMSMDSQGSGSCEEVLDENTGEIIKVRKTRESEAGGGGGGGSRSEPPLAQHGNEMSKRGGMEQPQLGPAGDMNEESMDVDEVILIKDNQDTNMSIDISEDSRQQVDSTLILDESQSMSSMPASKSKRKLKGPGAIPFSENANFSMPATGEGDVSMSNMTFVDECSNQSNSNMTEKSSRPKRSRLEIHDEEGIKVFPAERLFEYQWPQDGGEWYLLQEQVSEYLGVLSFKRKYPDLTRRTCEAMEKDFLRDRGVVTETQSDLGLTAVRSDEICDLMLKDYPEKYHEYETVMHEREKQKVSIKNKEYEEAQERLEKSKMAMYMKKAAKSAAEFNRNFLRERKEERMAYFDLQTFRIHYQVGRYKKLPPECTKPSPYPVALMPGQFQDHYCRFTSDELRYLPMNTALFDPPKKMKTTLAKPATESDDAAETVSQDKSGTSSDAGGGSGVSDSENTGAAKNTTAANGTPATSTNGNTNNGSKTPNVAPEISQTPIKIPGKKKTPGKTPGKTPTPGKGRGKKKAVAILGEEASTSASASEVSTPASPAVKTEKEEEDDKDKCRICESAVLFLKYKRVETMMIKCSECGKIAHPSCLDLTEKMVQVVSTYPWQCMECKTCVECMDPYDEDKMLFCDRCDRGYHTFCVGLRCLPSGRWECRSCKDVVETTKVSKRGRGRGRGRGANHGSRGGARGGSRSGTRSSSVVPDTKTVDTSTDTADVTMDTEETADQPTTTGTATSATATDDIDMTVKTEGESETAPGSATETESAVKTETAEKAETAIKPETTAKAPETEAKPAISKPAETTATFTKISSIAMEGRSETPAAKNAAAYVAERGTDTDVAPTRSTDTDVDVAARNAETNVAARSAETDFAQRSAEAEFAARSRETFAPRSTETYVAPIAPRFTETDFAPRNTETYVAPRTTETYGAPRTTQISVQPMAAESTTSTTESSELSVGKTENVASDAIVIVGDDDDVKIEEVDGNSKAAAEVVQVQMPSAPAESEPEKMETS